MNVTRWCGDCAADAAFAPFDCAEHPEACVELVCVRCGAGFEAGPVQVVGARVRGRARRNARREVTPAA
jgi:hypothetical protein